MKLNEFTKEEWRDVTKKLRPDWTEDQFDKAWNEFAEAKRRKSLQ